MSYLRDFTSLPPSKYPAGHTHTVPARGGVAVPLARDQVITVTNTHGTQVIDFWFLSLAGPPALTNGGTAVNNMPASHSSMCHTRASTLHLSPRVGDALFSNHRQPMIRLEEDSAAARNPMGHAVHDTLIAACDIYRYYQLGVPVGEWHDSCTNNFRQALNRDVGTALDDDVSTPDPLNLWMNIPVTPNEGGGIGADLEGVEVPNVSAGAALAFEKPVSVKGDYVRLRALVDGVVVMSACPQDILKINDLMPTDAAFKVDGP